MNRIDNAIRNRETVAIGSGAGHAVGMRGIALGYNVQYDTVKVGFVNESGEYTGEYTKVGAAHIEFIETEEPVTDHNGCGSNEERSPFSTGRKTCTGPVTGRSVLLGLGTSWKWAKHWDDYAQDSD